MEPLEARLPPEVLTATPAGTVHPKAIELLRAHEALQGAPDSELEEIASQMTCHEYQAGQPLFRQGEQPEGFQILESGEISLWTRVGDERKQLTVFRGGEPLCASGVIASTARTTSADAIKASRVWQLHRNAIHAMRTRLHPLSFRLMEWSVRHSSGSFLFAFPATLERIGAEALDSELKPQPPPSRPLTAADEPLLRVIPFLRAFTPARMGALLSTLRAVQLPRGTPLLARGADASSVYLVVRGALEASARTDLGKVRHGIRGPGRVVGHEAFFSGAIQPLDVVAKESSLLLELDRPTFDRLFAARDPLSLDWIEWASWSLTVQFDAEMRELVRQACERAEWTAMHHPT